MSTAPRLPAGCTFRHPLADAALARARALLVREFPYFDADVCTLQPVYAAGYGTFGVSPRRVLIVDPDILPGGKAAKWSTEEVAGVLIHELFHPFNQHAERADQHGATDRGRWNTAGDAEINDDLDEMFARPGITVRLPKGGVFPRTLGLPEHQLAEFYYDHMPANAPSTSCGGAAGNPGALEAELDAVLGRSDAELAADRAALAEAICAAENAAPGTMPAGVLRTALDYRKPAVMPWSHLLAAESRAATVPRPGDLTPTYRRPRRAMSAMVGTPGALILPARRAMAPRVAVAVDTSASMSAQHCTRGLAETVGICRVLGARVRFYAVDAAVHVAREVDAGTDFAALLVGNGGTNFNPLFDAIAALDPRERPSLLVVVTDGYATVPAECQPGLRVIWLLTPDGRPPCEWGRAIHLPDDA